MTLPLSLRSNRQTVTLTGPITIDSGTDRGRFLPSARRIFPAALPHDSVQKAFENVARAAQGTIIGHGVDAFLGAGLGSTLRHDNGRHLCKAHEATWGPIVDALTGKKIERLTIFACSVGAGASGAALVFALAKRLKAKVRAPLGDVWIDDVTKQPCMTKDGGWQEATPDMAAPPAAAGAPVFARTATASLRQPHAGNMLVFDRDRFLQLPFATIKSIAWQDLSTEQESQPLQWSDATVRDLARSLAFSPPVVFGGAVAAFVTGRLTVTSAEADGEHTREFLVYNNRLIEDVKVPGVFYRVDASALAGVAPVSAV